MKFKGSIKTSMILGAILSSLSLCSLSTNIAKAEDSFNFAGGNNSISSGTVQDSKGNGWGIAFGDAVDSGNAVVGARVTIVSCSDETLKNKVKTMSPDQLLSEIKNGNYTFHYMTANGVRNFVDGTNSYSSYWVYDTGGNIAGQYYTYACNYVPFPGKTGMEYSDNTCNFVAKSNGGSIVYALTRDAKSPSWFYNSLDGNASSLFNGAVTQVNADRRWFCAADNTGSITESGDNSLPAVTQKTILNSTQYIVNNSYISKGDTIIWFVEPLISLDYEIVDSSDNHSWIKNVASTPSMIAYYASVADTYGLGTSGLNNNVNRLDEMVHLYSTNGLSGNRSYDWKSKHSTILNKIPGINTSYMRDINTQSYGAYAVVITPEQTVSHDKLPEIPSVPVFYKDGDSISYSGVSATISKNDWKDITEVLSYGMNLTDTVPRCSLYSGSVATCITVMRQYSDNVYDENGNYWDTYIYAYKDVWNWISQYYSDHQIATIDNENKTVSFTTRSQINQPGSVSGKFGGNSGPFEVDKTLGNIANDTTLEQKSVSIYSLGNSLGIVNTAAPSLSELGSIPGGVPSFNDVLKNPYAYSIVIENEDNITTEEWLPERPNVVVYDEESGKKWDATIDNQSWSKILNTLRYARGIEGGSNDLNLQSANDARNYMNAEVDGVTISDTNKYNIWLYELQRLENHKNSLVEVQGAIDTAIGHTNDFTSKCKHVVDWHAGSKCGYFVDINYESSGERVRYLNWLPYYNEVMYGLFQSNYEYGRITQYYDGNGPTLTDVWKSKMDTYYYNYYDADLYVRWSNVDYYDTITWNGSPLDYNSIEWFSNWCGYGSYCMPSGGPGWDFADACGVLWAYSLKETYSNSYGDDMKSVVSEWISNDIDQIRELQDKINQWKNNATAFNRAYERLLDEIPDKFANMYLVNAAIPVGNVDNDVTDKLTERNGNKTVEQNMSRNYQTAQIQFNDSGNATWSRVGSDNWYSAYKPTDTTNYIKYPIDGVKNSLKPQLDQQYNQARNKLTFRYRVVTTDSKTKAMTQDNIENYTYGSCASTLSYKTVLENPYSMGIILNSFDSVKTSTEIKQWQASKRMVKDEYDDSSIWKWNNSNPTPSFDFEPTSSNMRIKQLPNWGLGQIRWTTEKISGSTVAGLSVNKSSIGRNFGDFSAGVMPWSMGNVKETAIYKITGDWGENSGTIEIMTAEITAKSYKSSGNSEEVTGTSSFGYDAQYSGSNFDIWLDNGEIEFRPEFPMMIASEGANTALNPRPLVSTDIGVGHNVMALNTDAMASAWYVDWFTADHTHKLTSQFEVKVGYSSVSRITTTFSTDEQDISSMPIGSSNAVPYVKAGQSFEVEVNNNVLTLDGYCNVNSNSGYVVNNNSRFKTADQFIDYMNGIADQLKDCDAEVLSTVNGFNVKADGTPVTNNGTNPNLHEQLAVKHTLAGASVDNGAGVTFKDGRSIDALNTSETKTYSDYEFPGYTGWYSGIDVGGPFSTASLSKKTQGAYNRLLNSGEGDTNWYYEYSEALGIVHVHLEIRFDDYKFNCAISRYESDFNTAKDEYLLNQYSGIYNAWSNSFNYDTYLRDDGNGEICNVISTAIDISGLTGDAAELFTTDTGQIQAILGRQTPIHIRGSVYDNT